MNKTVVIQIGNSDDKLSQRDWSFYVDDVQEVVELYEPDIHFFSASPGNAQWQNACWVIAMDSEEVGALMLNLGRLRKRYQQDSIAVLVGETLFIKE